MFIDGNKLRKVIAEKYLLVADVQRETGLNQNTLYRLVNNGGKARLATAGKIATALGVPLEAICRG